MLVIPSHKSEGRTLNEVLALLTGDFFIVTKKVTVDKEQVLQFVEQARAKSMNDFNIAQLVKHDTGLLVSYLK